MATPIPLANLSSTVKACGGNADTTAVWGVTLAVLGSIASNTGNNIQSLGFKQLHEKVSKKRAQQYVELRISSNQPTGENGSMYVESVVAGDGKRRDISISACESRTWLSGTVIWLCGCLFNFASYGLAAHSVLASLQAIQFITNTLLSKILFKKKLLNRMLAGTVLIVAGTVLTVSFGSSRCLVLNTSKLKELWLPKKNPCWTAYLVMMVIGSAFSQCIHLRYQESADTNTAGNEQMVLPITYAIVTVPFGTITVVQAKALAELFKVWRLYIRMEPGGENIWDSWLSYFTLFSWAALNIVWVVRLNVALERYDALFILPLLQSGFMLFAIISGGIFYQEFDEFSVRSMTGFCSGICLILVGLYLLRPEIKAQIKPELENLECSGNGAPLGKSTILEL